MTLVSVVTETGAEGAVEVAKHDLVAEVKSRIISQCFPILRGQMISLSYHGKELMDEKSVGDYGIRNLNGVRLVVAVNPRQPYSKIDYNKLSESLIREGYKRDPSKFYHPGDEWQGRWVKGDEYKSYPPVDVDNPFSSIPPSESRELAFRGSSDMNGGAGRKKGAKGGHDSQQMFANGVASDGVQRDVPDRIRRKWVERAEKRTIHEQRARTAEQEERERHFRRARQKSLGSSFDKYTESDESGQDDSIDGDSGRTYQSLYACFVGGNRFEVMHKAEGKWMGDATFLDSKFHRPVGSPHVCSSVIGYNEAKGAWCEHQLITGESGVSTKQNFWYFPITDGQLMVEAEEVFKGNATIKLQELGPNIMLMTATSPSGNPILTETITYSEDFRARVRSGQRFTSQGAFLATYTCHERKYVDQDTGALEPIYGASAQ